MKEVILIVEGGGNRQVDANLRDAIDLFVAPLKTRVRNANRRWRTIPGYGRDDAYQEFLDRTKNNPESLVVLLVDSEGTMDALPAKWVARLQEEPRLFFMVQCFEAWIVADAQGLEAGLPGLKAGRLPKRPPEECSPEELRRDLQAATQDCGWGPYKKKHGPLLLALVRPEVVAKQCPSARAFLDRLNRLLN